MAAVFRAVFGYTFLVFVVRIVGRRPGKQITPFEFVLVFFMGGVVLTPLVGADRSFTNAVIQIIAIALTHYAIAWGRQRSDWFARLVDGTPLILLERGKQRIDTMRNMRIQAEDIMAMARDSSIKSVDEIEYAVLERNGEIHTMRKEEK